jgi:putative flippase GtrA
MSTANSARHHTLAHAYDQRAAAAMRVFPPPQPSEGLLPAAGDGAAAAVVPFRRPQPHDGQCGLTPSGPGAAGRALHGAAALDGGHLAIFCRFAVVGLSGTVVDVTCFFLFGQVVPMLAARGSAIWLAMTWNFFWNRRVTFAGAREDSALRQYASFCGACAAGAAVNWAVSVGLYVGSPWFAGHAVAAAMVGVGCGLLLNYAACRSWVFRRCSPADECASVAFPGGGTHQPESRYDDVMPIIVPFPVGGHHAEAA